MPALVVVIVLLLSKVNAPLAKSRIPALAVAFVLLRLALTVTAPP